MNMNACKLKKIEAIGSVRTAKDTQSAFRCGQLKTRILRFGSNTQTGLPKEEHYQSSMCKLQNVPQKNLSGEKIVYLENGV